MRMVLTVVAGWTGVSLVAGLVFVVGSSLGYRRGYEDGFEAGLASPAQRMADPERGRGEARLRLPRAGDAFPQR